MAAAGISEASVRRIWQAHGLKPRGVETFKLSNDPAFAEKLKGVVGLYRNAREHALMLCVDEKRQIQALDRMQPGLPMKEGRGATMTHDYRRNGTATLFATLNAANGEVLGLCQEKHRHQEWLSLPRMPEAGVTLVGLIVTVAALSVLASALIPLARFEKNRDQKRELRQDLWTTRAAIDKYKDLADRGTCQNKANSLGYPRDLQTLVSGVGIQGHKYKLLRRIPVDPMTGKAEQGMHSNRDDPDSAASAARVSLMCTASLLQLCSTAPDVFGLWVSAVFRKSARRYFEAREA